MGKEITIEARRAGRRRRYTAEQKRALLNEAARPGGSISEVARRYGIAPSVMFLWRRTMDDASETPFRVTMIAMRALHLPS